MRSKRGVVAAAGVVLTVAVLSGGFVGAVGVAEAGHGTDSANFTVIPMSDRSPGAENVRYGQRVVANAGTDLETLERTRATFEEGSFSKCGPSSGETFGIDRGATKPGYGIDEDLTDNVKSFSAGEDVFEVEYYGEDDFGASTYMNDGDEFVSVAKCIDNPDEPGWYQMSGSTTGVTESGERVTFKSESHYFWICNCEDEAEARRTLGPPPSEPRGTPTATPTPTDASGDQQSGGRDANGDGTTDAERTSPQRSTATPTGTATAAGPTATAAAGSNDASSGADGTGGDAASTVGRGTPTEAWDDHVLQTPTAAEGPGFGAAPALLALLGAALFLTRRR